MNAPTETPAVQFQHLALDELVPSGSRVQALRRARFADDELAELAESLKTQGMIEPIVARPRPDLGSFHAEIVAGERRWLAARIAGLAEVPVIVRPLTEAEALGVQLVENLQRKGLDPLEEAEGYSELMRLRDLKPDDLVAITGKSRSWVYDRLKLLKLPDAAREALARGEIDVSRALVVSKYEGEQAQHALELALDKFQDELPTYSVRELAERLKRDFRPEEPEPDPAPAADDDEEPEDGNNASGTLQDEAEKRRAQLDRERKEREARAAYRLALFKACAAKARGPLTTAEIIELAIWRSHMMPGELIFELFGAPELPDDSIRKMKASDLGYLLRMSLVADNVNEWGEDDSELTALAKRLKVDVAKVKAGMKAEGKKKAAKK